MIRQWAVVGFPLPNAEREYNGVNGSIRASSLRARGRGVRAAATPTAANIAWPMRAPKPQSALDAIFALFSFQQFVSGQNEGRREREFVTSK